MWEFDGTGYLCHYGRKGQKWGVRNGPPYPIKELNPTIKSIKIATSNGLLVKGISDHAQDQMTLRHVSSMAVVDALKNPLKINPVKIDKEGRPSQRFIGQNATVNVNPKTGIIPSLWETGRHTVKKINKEKGL